MRGERPICGGWYVIERGGETCVLVCARDLCGGHPAARFLYRCARVCGEGLLWRQKGMYTVSACSRGLRQLQTILLVLTKDATEVCPRARHGDQVNNRQAMTERVQVATTADPCGGGELPEFPDRLRAAGIAEEDFKNVFQKCLDAEFCKIATLPITILTGGLGVIFFCVPDAPCDINRGKVEFNKKYEPQGIKCERPMIEGWVYEFVVPAQAASQAVVVAAAPVPVEIARDADPAETLAQLKSLLEKELITQADYEEKKAQILAGM